MCSSTSKEWSKLLTLDLEELSDISFPPCLRKYKLFGTGLPNCSLALSAMISPSIFGPSDASSMKSLKDQCSSRLSPKLDRSSRLWSNAGHQRRASGNKLLASLISRYIIPNIAYFPQVQKKPEKIYEPHPVRHQSLGKYDYLEPQKQNQCHCCLEPSLFRPMIRPNQ